MLELIGVLLVSIGVFLFLFLENQESDDMLLWIVALIAILVGAGSFFLGDIFFVVRLAYVLMSIIGAVLTVFFYLLG